MADRRLRAVTVDEDRLTDLARSRAVAEAAEWSAMLDYAVGQEAAANAGASTEFARQANIAVIALEIGTATGLSEHQVHRRLTAAERVRDQAPATWLAFGSGHVDAGRVMAISDAIAKLKRETSVVRLDQRVVAYAESHTLAELRLWLKRFVARVESDLLGGRADDERKERRVQVLHGDDGMSWLSAYLPSYVAAAIDKRLTREATSLGADDDRNLQQRRADLLAAWMTTSDAGEPAIHTDIAVTISAEALAGVNADPIIASDGSWVLPAAWISDLLAAGNVVWHRIITDPAGQTLDHTYLGRFAPETLATAISFRDGVCQAPGCTRSAEQCDRDHRVPHPEGPTSGANMWALCRRHHQLKGHQVLRWMLPSGREAPVEKSTHSPPLGDISWGEHHLATIVVAHD